MKQLRMILVLALVSCADMVRPVTALVPSNTEGLAELTTYKNPQCPNGSAASIWHYRWPYEESLHWLETDGWHLYLKPGTYLLGYECQAGYANPQACDFEEVGVDSRPEFEVRVAAGMKYVFKCDSAGKPKVYAGGG